jgi:hypothetical protein
MIQSFFILQVNRKSAALHHSNCRRDLISALGAVFGRMAPAGSRGLP